MIFQIIAYTFCLLSVLAIDIYTYVNYIRCLLNITEKDGIPILVSIITTTTIVPVYLFTRLKEYNDKKLEVDKSKSIKNYDLKYELFKNLVPYLYIKNSSANASSFTNLHSNLQSYLQFAGIEGKFDFTELSNYSKEYDSKIKNPRYQVFNFAQSAISQIRWTGHLLFSQKTLDLMEKYNKLEYYDNIIEHSEKHMEILKNLIESMRIELKSENIDQK